MLHANIILLLIY